MNFLHQIGFIQYPLLVYSLMTLVALSMSFQNPTSEIRRTVRYWGLVTLTLGILGTAVGFQQNQVPSEFYDSASLNSWLTGSFPNTLAPLVWGSVVASIAMVGVAMTGKRSPTLSKQRIDPYPMVDSEPTLF